jgi:hypothetical protein
MRVPLFAIAISASTTSLASSSAIPPSLLAGWHTIQRSELKKDIAYLASNNLGGRLSLTVGDDKAIKWVADQFKEAGLQPLIQDSYLQSVPLISFFPDRKKSYIELITDKKIIRWEKPNIYINFPDDIKLTGEVVFAGYGITAPALQYDDYEDIDANGKIVLIFEHEPQENDPHSVFDGIANTIYAAPRTKILNAQKHGAIAVLIVPEPNRKHPSRQEQRQRYKRLLNTLIPSQELVDSKLKIPVVRLKNQVANQIVGNGISLSHLQSAIDDKFKPQSINLPNIKVTINNKNKSRCIANSYNVAGLLEGSDSELKQETVIISAHHDHDGKNGRKIWHGADDNASGTIGVITLARAMIANTRASDGMKPKRSILFVVFAAEERGLLGSSYMADHPLRPIETTRAMINFDMIGRNESPSIQTKGLIDTPSDTANRLNFIGSHYSPDYNRTVIRANQFVGLDLDYRFNQDAALNILFRSDQFPFILHKVPAFSWFTGFHQDYHQITDTADKINFEKMKKILQLAYLSAFDFANEKIPPRFIENPIPDHHS